MVCFMAPTNLHLDECVIARIAPLAQGHSTTASDDAFPIDTSCTLSTVRTDDLWAMMAAKMPPQQSYRGPVIRSDPPC